MPNEKLPFSARGNYVLIRVDEPEKTTTHGIQLEATTRGQKDEQAFQYTGVVVDIGPLAFKYSDGFHPWVKIGEKISFTNYEGQFLRDKHDVPYRLIADSRCGCVVNTDRGE